MLSLLIKTRFKYYRNYICYHFDRTTKIEIALIFLVLLLLTFRSPADIGYNFKWMYDENFPRHWANFFSIYLIIFYIISEAVAFYTLRLSTEWQLLGSLPFSKISITNYYLFRHLSKTILLILISCLPILLSFSSSVGLRALRFFDAIGILLFLQLMAFNQAYRLRNTQQTFPHKILRWFIIEVVILGFILINAPWLQSVFSKSFNSGLFGLLLLWIVLLIFWWYIHKTFVLRDRESRIIQRRKSLDKKSISLFATFMRGFYKAFIIHDILFLWRQKRSSFLILILASVIATTICIAENSARATYISLLFLEVLFGLLLINPVLLLFKRDVEAFGLIRSLPVTAASLWLTRWLLLVGLISTPILIPILIILIKFGISLEFFLFIITAIGVIPAVMATVFCNSVFGMFPHINLSGYIISVSIILMFLFWFFMPFGTLIILIVMIFWIRKSQKHLQLLETI
jgi:hypothetical protein